MTTIQCTREDAGAMAIDCLARHIPAAPAAFLRQLLQKGKILRGGIPVAARDAVRDGDVLVLPGSRRLQACLAASAREPTILFESREILIVAKPAGLAVHRGVGHEADNLTDRLQQVVRERKEPYRIAPVHRIDAGTSGPVLFGKGRKACAVLGQLFMDGEVEKFYLGLAAGHLAATGELSLPVPAKGKLKKARTEYRSITRFARHSLLELRLHSGRTHQIRRQLAASGHPLAGDRRYGGADLPGLNRLFLHSCRLLLTNPFDGARLDIECPLPSELGDVLKSLHPMAENLDGLPAKTTILPLPSHE